MPRLPGARSSLTEARTDLSGWVPRYTNSGIAIVSYQLEQLRQIQRYTLLYLPQGGKGPNRVATVLSKQSLPQQRLAQEIGLDQLGSTPRR